MNVRQLLRCGGDICSPPAVESKPAETAAPKFEQVTLDESVDPKKFELSDEDAEYLLGRLMELGDKYFRAEGLVMTHDIIGDLLYHIPVGFVQASKRVKEMDLPDVMDPIMSLYPMFTVATIGDVYYEYLSKIRCLLSEESGFFSSIDSFNNRPAYVQESAEEEIDEDPTEDEETDYEPEGEPEDEEI